MAVNNSAEGTETSTRPGRRRLALFAATTGRQLPATFSEYLRRRMAEDDRSAAGWTAGLKLAAVGR